nr:bifunctional riboflavin kinase/FAD synthetase [Bowmanella yangjiangensis]
MVELIRGLHNIRDKHKGCVLTIGKFDGVHLGHQAVLRSLIEKARAMQLPATVMVFEPQPEEVFSPEHAPARISRLRDKYEQLRLLGVDRLLCIRFDRAFSQMSACYFIEELLVRQLGIRFLVVGDDFRFGKARLGDFTMLQEEGRRCDFDVVSTRSFRLEDCRISSTEVRSALALSEFSRVEAMLGRPFSISGKVVHGDKKGRTLGFPTANVLLNRCKAPLAGVFAVRVNLNGQTYDGVANIGNRPTVNGQRSQLEVHVFEFTGALYGKRIEVVPVAKIRNEMKFASLEALQQQIRQDADKARELLLA